MRVKRWRLFAGAFGMLAVGLAVCGSVFVASPYGEHQLIAPGSVVIEASPVAVHANVGGRIAELRVRSGDHVHPGDVLMRLEGESISSAAVALALTQDELIARQARLRAEQSKAPNVTFPSQLARRDTDPEVAGLLAAEVDLFNARRLIQQGQSGELLDRIDKLQKEINAYGLQAASKSSELELVMLQLKAARELRAKSLIPSATLASLEREAIRLQGERDGMLGASIAQAEGRIAETRFLMFQIERDREAEVMRDLRDTTSKLAEVSDRQRSVADQLRRFEITAPEAGIVGLPATRSIGSVVAVDDEIVTIAPTVEGFAIDASIAQADIGALRLGQSVTVQLPMGSGQEGTQLAGTLSQLEPVNGGDKQSTYKARIALALTDCTRVGPVQPGTEARVMLEANRRSMLSILAPVGDGLIRALRAI
jgi:HlyD family secretion protein